MCYFIKTQLPFQLYILNNTLYLKCLYVLVLGYFVIKAFHINQMCVLALVSNIPKILKMRETTQRKLVYQDLFKVQVVGIILPCVAYGFQLLKGILCN